MDYCLKYDIYLFCYYPILLSTSDIILTKKKYLEFKHFLINFFY